jgi:hypothetical protein
MRTKTMLVSALLGTLGSVAVMAQSNVYSLNVVGYVNAIIPPGWSVVTCPLNCSPDNSLNTLLNNANNAYWVKHFSVVVAGWTGGGYNANDSTVSGGWGNGGTMTINPGTAVFINNPFPTNLTPTWVGSVPTGSQTNTLSVGYNLVGSTIPVTGDLVTNTISTLNTGVWGDIVSVWDPVGQGFNINYSYLKSGSWSPGNPTPTNVCEGFFYYVAGTHNGNSAEHWVENFSL